MHLLILGIIAGMAVNILILLLILRTFEKKIRSAADMVEIIKNGMNVFEGKIPHMIEIKKELESLRKEKEECEKEK